MARHRGQGAFEYILMLSGVLLVVITTTYMMQGSVAQADNTLDAQMKAAGIALDPSYYVPGVKPQFLPSSPADGFGSTSRPNITAAITVKDAALNSLQFNWNGANYSIYDQSLALSLNFEDSGMIGETAGKAVDTSNFGNNGAIYGNTQLLLHMDEGSGTTTTDSSRFAINGTISGADWTAGKYGYALAFDGTDDYVSIGNPAGLNGLLNISICAWVNFANFSTNTGWVKTIYSKGSESAGRTVWLGYGNQSGTMRWYWEIGNGVTYDALTPSDSIQAGQWYHIVATFANGTYAIYKNGALFSTSNRNIRVPVTTGYNAFLGRYSLGVQHMFNGTIDEFMIANRTLSASEVLARYNAGAARHANWEVNGKWGSGMKFDGIDDQVIIPNSASVNITGNITVAAWTRKEQMPCTTNPGPPITYPGCHDQPVIVKGDSTGPSATTPYILTWGWWNDFYFRLWATDATSMSASVPGGISNGDVWHHVAGTYDGTNISVYVDGILAATRNYTAKRIAFSSQNVYIGKLPNGQLYQGGIDEVRIWNRALSASEINMQYRSNLYKYTPNAWFFDYRNDSLAFGTYNYTLYTSGGYRKDGTSETRTVRYCQVPWPC